MKKLVLITFLIVSLYGCKTAEEIQREKMVDTMSVQMLDLQKMAGDLTVKMQNFDQKIGSISGQLEETDHAQKTGQEEINQRVSSEITLLKDSLADLTKKQNEMSSALTKISKDLEQQRKFIDKILGTLKKVASEEKTTEKKSSDFDQAISDYQRGAYTKAYPALQELLNSNKLSGQQTSRVLHNLGIIAFSKKNYDDSMVYLSKLFTEYPQSGYNKNGLYHLGKIFVLKNDPTKAKQVWQQLISKWPESDSAKTAKKDMENLK